jgi:predicted MPP superfamily phosphohydrolase
LYLLMAFVLLDICSAFRIIPKGFLKDSWGVLGCVAGAVTALLILGGIHYHHKYREELTVKTSKPLEKPLTVVLASDLHLGYHNRKAELKRWVDLINAERPDAVLMAGDLVDRSLRPLLAEDMAAELRRIEAPVYACLGNHEYYADYYTPGEVEQFYRDAGIVLLQDSVATLGNIIVLGRDDRTNPRRLSVRQLQEKFSVADTRYSVLLDHQPYHLEEAEKAGIDLQLSGHTHRGQVWPVSWITDALYECSWGSLRKGTTDYYVSSGLGIWGAKYRIGTQSEYVVVDVR